jgi:hypothetical protein
MRLQQRILQLPQDSEREEEALCEAKVVSWLEMAEGRSWKPHPLQPDLEPPERAESLAEACFRMRLIRDAPASYRRICASVAGTVFQKGPQARRHGTFATME